MTEPVPSAVAAQAAAEWDLELVERTASRYSDTWFARHDDEHVVLKVGEDGARSREAAALRAYAGADGAAAELLAQREGALLLRRVIPGDDLRSVADHDDDAATTVIGALVMGLQRAAAGSRPPELPMLADIGQTFVRYEDSGSGIVPADLVDRAQQFVTELTAPAGSDGVLHGDLHHSNVLRSGWRDSRWVAIDPHGWWGDPVFDLAAGLLNPHERIAVMSDPAPLVRRRAALLAEVTGFDRARIEAWAFAGAVISELWCLEDHGFVTGGPLRLARQLAS